MPVAETLEQNKARPISRIGMFDMLKGLGMLMVVFGHTIEIYPIKWGGMGIPIQIFFTYRDVLMAAFYIVSGYGFRKRPISKCLTQQRKTMLLPYLWTTAGAALLHLVCHYAAFRMPKEAGIETLRVLGGFALGIPRTTEYFGFLLFSCGAMWYLLAMVVGWVLLDILLNLLPERFALSAVVTLACVGWAVGNFFVLPFCLTQGMMVAYYLYIGYQCKRLKLLEQPLPWWYWVLFWESGVLVAVNGILTGYTDGASAVGPFNMICSGVIGIGIVSLFVRWNRSDNALTRGLEKVGNASLVIFCAHSVENAAVPWYLLVERFADAPVKGMLLQLVLRSAFIALVCAVLSLKKSRNLRTSQ